jgi:succinate dehydrogenase / fumarate reductase membrane anchor subunit
MWLFMRFSGLALLFLALSHFGLQHLISNTHRLTSEDTIIRWGLAGETITPAQLFWRVYYGVMVLLAMLHGLNGLRQVAYDYLQKKWVYQGFMALAAALILAVTAMGVLALIVGVNASGAVQAMAAQAAAR